MALVEWCEEGPPLDIPYIRRHSAFQNLDIHSFLTEPRASLPFVVIQAAQRPPLAVRFCARTIPDLYHLRATAKVLPAQADLGQANNKALALVAIGTAASYLTARYRPRHAPLDAKISGLLILHRPSLLKLLRGGSTFGTCPTRHRAHRWRPGFV